MTNKNFSMVDGKRIGFAPNLITTLSRPDSVSSSCRCRVLTILLLCLTLGVGQMWGVTFTAGTDMNSTKTITKDGVTLTLSSGCANLDGYSEYRIYASNSFTISSSSNIISVVVTTNTAKGNATKLSVTSGYSASGTSGTWSGKAKSVQFSASEQVRVTQIVVTLEASYSVVWTINPAAGGNLSTTSGASTTVTPNNAYTYGDPAYSVTSGTASVSQSSNTFSATPSANCTIRINMVEKPKYKITYNAGTGSCATTSWTQTVADESTTLPSATTTCSGWTFVGWCTSSAGSDDENSTSPGSILTGSYKPTSDVTLYAVYTRSVSGAVTPASITITPASFSGLGSSNYGSGAERTGSQSGISLGGHYITANNANKTNGWSGGEYIQMQNGNGNLYNKTAFSGAITKIVVNQYAASTINLYCGNGNSQLIASNNTNTGQTPSGTLITKPDNSTSMEWTMAANNNYKYFDIKAGATNYISSIVVTYNAAGSSTTYYMTSLVCCTPLGSINGSFS